MEIVFKSDTKQRKWRFIAKSFSHPAKMSLPLQLWLIEHYTQPGDWILDPMAGSGTLLVACSLSRNVILVELEEKFVSICEDNWERVQEVGAELGHTMGQAIIRQGDARELETILDDAFRVRAMLAIQKQAFKVANLAVDKIITSPPYIAQISTSKQTEGLFKGRRLFEQGKDPQPHSEGQVGDLPYGIPDVIISSPPYSETGVGDWQTSRAEFQEWVKQQLAENGYIEWQGKRYTEREWRDMNYGRLDGRVTKGVHKHPTDGYSSDPANIGNLLHGDIDTIITSPPYEGSLEASSRHTKGGIPRRDKVLGQTGTYGNLEDAEIVARKVSKGFQSDKAIKIIKGSARGCSQSGNNLGNLKGQTYLSEMQLVYAQCYKVLKPSGLMVLVVKNFIRNKTIVPLDEHTIKLCENIGFQLIERHYRRLTQQSFWRTIYQQKYPDAPVVDREHILVFRRQ